MEIKFYKNSSDNNVLSKKLSDELVKDCSFRGDVDILNPTVTISSGDNLSAFNYCYIPRYGRYYYARPTILASGLWVFECNVDVLMTYKDDIKKCRGIISRSKAYPNSYIQDDIPIESYKLLATKAFPSGIKADSMYLITIG